MAFRIADASLWVSAFSFHPAMADWRAAMLAAQMTDMDDEEEDYHAERFLRERLALARNLEAENPVLQAALSAALAEASAARSALAEARRTLDVLVEAVVFSANRNCRLETQNSILTYQNRILQEQAQRAEQQAERATRQADALRLQLARLFSAGLIVTAAV